MKKKIILVGLILATQINPTIVNAEDVVKGISKEYVINDFSLYTNKFFQVLKNDKEKRRSYVKRIYTNKNLELAAKEKNIDRNQRVLSQLSQMRTKLYLEELVIAELEKSSDDFSALAKERYEYDKSKYKTRKKIKMAVIFLKKEEGKELEAKKKLEEIVEELKENKDDPDLFHNLAKKYSEDTKAKMGGINKKWLISPVNITKSNNLMQQVFAMDTIGEMTDIIETQAGFQVFKLMSQTPSVQFEFSEVEQEIIDEIKSEVWKSKQADVMKTLEPSDEVLDQFNDKLLENMIEEEYVKRYGVKEGAVESGVSEN